MNTRKVPNDTTECGGWVLNFVVARVQNDSKRNYMGPNAICRASFFVVQNDFSAGTEKAGH
jgi:hypothetical protein